MEPGRFPKESTQQKWMEPRVQSEKVSLRRSRFAAGVACCALAFFATHSGGTTLFVASPADVFTRTQVRADSLIICAAEGKPGSAPSDVEQEAPPSSFLKVKIGKREYTLDQQSNRKETKSKWLRKLKGKFVYRGPKPYDPDRFTKVSMSIKLQPKQASNTKIMNQVIEELRRISGKHPVVCKAKVDNAKTKLRKGDVCGAKVSLEGQLMHDFLARLNTIILPRVRDFEGLYPNSFDNNGNFWFSVPSQEAFRELDELVDQREIVHGFQIGILNNCFTQPDALKLMKEFGFPFGEPRPKRVRVSRDPYAKFRKRAKKVRKGLKKV
eukprot:symbB.v1.2.008141.t1/scaffold509.1/size193965/11